MKKIFFTPGPSQLYPTVAAHINKALEDDIGSISHRSDKFHRIYKKTQGLLRKLLKIPGNYHIFFLSSGTEAMERIIENTVENCSLHFVGGAFSGRFWQTAELLGKTAKKIEAPPGSGFDFKKINIDKKAELICVTHNETSSGVAIPMEEIYDIKKRLKNILIAVDTVSSAPYVNINYKYTDLCFFSVQKGFGLPAGLGVLIVSPQAIKTSEVLEKKNYSVGTYHRFSEILKYDKKLETPETPNVLSIYLLGKVAQDMLKLGVGRIRRETEEKAQLLYDFSGKQKGLKPFVKEKIFRSNTVIVLETRSDSLRIIGRLKKKGLVVGSGYGDFKNKHLRIANFPAHSLSDIKRLIREIKAI